MPVSDFATLLVDIWELWKSIEKSATKKQLETARQVLLAMAETR